MDKSKLNKYLETTCKVASQAAKSFQSSTDYQTIADEITRLQLRLNKRQLIIAVTGEVKAGKSTFINALIGKDICPSADIVCTNVPSIISYSESDDPLVRVIFQQDIKGNIAEPKCISFEEINQYASENLNPRNEKSVHFVEINVNSSLLKGGLTIIDTPGLGALDPRHAHVTMDISALADMILFVSNTNKQLTIVELDSLQNLINRSKTNHVAHILTGSDQGDAEIILDKNKEALEKKFPNLHIDCFAVSSTRMLKFRTNHDERFFEKSGFKLIFPYIDKVKAEQDSILINLCMVNLASYIAILKAQIDEIKGTAEDPEKFNELLIKLNDASSRLMELKNNAQIWRGEFSQQLNTLLTTLNNFILSRRNQIENEIDSLLTDDDYLKESSYLQNAINQKLDNFRFDLATKIKEGTEEIYENVRKTSGLKIIQSQIRNVNIDIPDLKIPTSVSNASVINNTIKHTRSTMAGAATGAILGPIAGAGLTLLGTAAGSLTSVMGYAGLAGKIGGLMGSVLPGLGNIIGGVGGVVVGAIAGLFASLFTSKESKRKKVSAACKNALRSAFVEINTHVTNTMHEISSALSSQFSEELEREKNYCVEGINNLTPRRNFAQSHMDTLNNWLNVLDAIYTEIKKDLQSV